MDVVAAADSLFSLQSKGERVMGRGVSDMKFSIPLGIALLNELIMAKSPVSFCLAITTDEETGGYEGGAFLAQQLSWRPRALLVPDGGDNCQFVEKAKGVCQLIITSLGKSAHASQPWNGQNALPALCQLVVELNARYAKNNEQPGWVTTMNIGALQGGVSTNQVCDQAVLKLDFRFPETDSASRITQEVTELANQIDPTLTIKPGSTGLPTFTDVKLPVVQKCLRCLEQEWGQPVVVAPTFGASDARHFASFNIPVLMIKPLGGDIHCATEWLDVPSTMQFYQGLRRLLGLKE
jgi:acetylornithine deacetylase/succinyl-diaminopimelate desuccinylase-like protein